MRNANLLSWLMGAAMLAGCSLAQDFGRFRQADSGTGDIDAQITDGGSDASEDGGDGGGDMDIVATRFSLVVSKTGDGTGDVTSDPLGISCGSTCSAEYESGRTVQLFATPASGSVFVGWAGACSGTSTCSVTMNSARAVTAMFARDSFTVVVSRGGTGTGSVAVEDASGTPLTCAGDGATCSVEVSGTNILRLIATPSGASTFLGWAGDCGGTVDSCTLFVDRDRDVGAVFADPSSTETVLIVSRAGTGAGEVRSSTSDSIVCGATCFGSYDPSAVVTLVATPEEGSSFGGWSGACASAGTSPTCEVLMSASQSVGATFSANRYAVTVNRLGSGSVVSTPAGILCSATSTQCATTLRHGTLVRLTASPDEGASFVSWQGGPCSGSTATTCEFTLTANVDVSANFSAMSFPLTVSKSGPGRVTTSPTGISCGDDCDEMFDFGMSVTLTATADSGASFIGWSGDCEDELSATCVVVMSSAHTVSAMFRSNINVLDVSLSGDGAGSVTSDPAGISCDRDSTGDDGTCDEEFFFGQTVTLTATPEADSTFAGWSGACTGSSPTCTLAVTDALEATATFVIGSNYVSVEKTGDGAARGVVFGTLVGSETAGGIDCGTTCVGTFEVGSQVQLVASALSGGSFAGWDPDGVCGEAGLEPTCIVDITGDPIVARARFDLQSFNVSVSKDGAGGGSVSSTPTGIDCGADCNESFVYGSSITLVASADGSSEFVSWAGCSSSMGVSCTISSIDSAKSITATFAKRRFTLTTTRTGAGVISSDPAGLTCGSTCSADFDADTPITLTAAPTDASSQFSSWSGCPSPTGNTCTLSLSAATTVSATFTTVPRALSITKTGGGSGTVTGTVGGAGDTPISCGAMCNADISHGSMVTLTAMAAANSTFVGWSGSGCMGTGSCVVTMDAAKNVTAEFALMTYTLTASREGAGAGTISATATPSGSGSFSCGASGPCTGTYNHGAMVTLTAAPDSASVFSGWSGEGCTGMGTCVVSTTAARNVTATFARRSYTLTVTIAGNGTVAVRRTSDSSTLLLCTTSGSICTASVEHGTSLSFQGTGSGLSSFNSWSGAITGSTNPSTLVVTSAATVTGNFSLTGDNVIVTKTGSGTGTVVASSGSINCGSTCSGGYLGSVTLTATPTSGTSTFVGWGGSCASAGTSPTCMVSPGLGVANVTAQFDLIQRTLTVDLAGTGTASIAASVITGGAGTFTCSSGAVPRTCSGTFPHGTTLKVVADPGAGTTFAGWTGGGCSGDMPCSLSMTADRSTVATFSLNSYTLTVAKDGSNPTGGTVTSSPAGINCNPSSADCSEIYPHGTSVTLTASNTASTVFAGWSGACSGASTTCVVAMNSAKNVTATFNTRMVTVTVTLSGGGQSFGRVTDSAGLLDCTSATDPCTYTVPYGSTALFSTSSSNPSKAVFAEWSGGTCSGPFYLCGRTLNNDVTLNARFENLRALTLNFSGTGVGGTTEAFHAQVGNSTIGFGAALGSCNIVGLMTPQTCELAVPVNTTFTLSPAMPAWAYVSAYSSPCSSPMGTNGRCEGSMSAASTVNVTISRRANIFFTTEETSRGNMGGLVGADSVCQSLATTATLPGTYVAWLSSSTTSASARVSGSAQGWINVNGDPIASSFASSGAFSFLDGGPRRYPNIDQNGDEIASPFEVWTHTAANGVRQSGTPCSNWASNLATVTAWAGRANGGRHLWTEYGTGARTCNQYAHLYCLSTDITTAPVYATPTPEEPHYGFVSSAGITGGAGLAAADAICQSDANSAGFDGTYRAYLSTTTQSVYERFNEPYKLEYHRPDGVSIGSWLEIFEESYSTTNFPQAPIMMLANGTTWMPSGPPTVWAGGDPSNGPKSPSTYNCSNWTSSSPSATTWAGSPNNGAYWATGGSAPCSSSQRFYCFRVAAP